MDPRIERTAELMSRARRVLAYGGLDGIVHRPLFHDGGTFPQFLERAEGCRIVDTTGQVFIDWVNGWGPTMLGYRHPAVERAIISQMVAGPSVSLMHPVEVEVAEALSEMIPCAEMVAFGKNGSDALTAAVRVARVVTGREFVLQYGMHGFHDWFVTRLAHVRGIPSCLSTQIASFPFNDLGALEREFATRPGMVAAVVMEPSREQEPAPGYLQGVKELCQRSGTLLVFDEVITALRFGNAGAQGHYGVVPDLACLGKSLANGMPLSALVGRREYMQLVPSVGFGMTFRGETLTLAAARAVLDVVRREPVAEHLAHVGERLRSAFQRDCAELGLDWSLDGHPARMSVRFAGGNGWDAEGLRDIFLQQCLVNGVFTNGNFLPSYAHDQVAIDETVRGVRSALDVAARAFHGGVRPVSEPIGGFPHGPRFHSARGAADRLVVDGEDLHLEGWLLMHDGPADEIRAVTPTGRVHQGVATPRPDIAAAFPATPRSGESGFRLVAIGARSPVSGHFEVDLVALRGGVEAFRCHIVKYSVSDRARPAPSGSFWLGDGVLYV